MAKVAITKFDDGTAGREYLRRLFLERVSDVPGLMPSLEKGLALPLGDFALWRNKPARAFLLEWSQGWHLDADWIRESAYNTLTMWPGPAGSLVYPGSLVGHPPPSLPTYFPVLQTRKEYLEQVDPLIRAYCEESERSFPLAKSMDDPARDIDWTVRFQVEKQECREIATRHDIDVDVVRKAVKRILRAIELPSRKVSRGRTKGSKNNPALAELGLNKNVRDF